MTVDDTPQRGADTGTAPVATTSERWLARLAFVAAAGSVLALFSGGRGSLVVLAVGVLGLVLVLAGVWWFLSTRGVLRWLAAGLVVAAAVGVVVFYIAEDRLLDIVVALVLAAVASSAGRAATASSRHSTGMPERSASPPSHPYLIMNPRSGGGKVGRFELDTKATALGADVALLAGPERLDVAELARAAAADGADLLGVAGGDGTQALVAGVAAELGLPFLVLSAGTRNHFALDLGLDREHPDAGLDALADGVELHDRPGPDRRPDVRQQRLVRRVRRHRAEPGVPRRQARHHAPAAARHPGRAPRSRDWSVRVDDEVTIDGPQALLVSNNPYGMGDLAGLGRRARLDTGRLGVVAITVDSAAMAAGLLSGSRAKGLRSLVAHEVVVDSDDPEIPVGIDGEAVLMPTPVRCTIRPLALRVRVPRTRPGVPAERPPVDRALLRRQALTLRHLARAGRSAASGEVAVHRPARELREDRAQQRADHDVAGEVHPGVHARVRDRSGQARATAR